ncbi:hypothetical protein BXU06_09305 [Aquaspirillum sp. LM1]|nr:hypothetical protein BXU06_09305 [Aquaspirillum sp. LM1]
MQQILYKTIEHRARVGYWRDCDGIDLYFHQGKCHCLRYFATIIAPHSVIPAQAGIQKLTTAWYG